METEKASHEEEERLILTSPSILQLNGNKITKLQNGNQSPGRYPQEVNGNVTWNHFKSYTEVSQMKKHHEIHSHSAEAQNMFDHNSYVVKGEMKNAIREPFSLRLHQSKKLRAHSEVNGTADNIKVPPSKGELHCFPDLMNAEDVDCDVLQEQQLDAKNCIFADGGVFSHSRNKLMAASNGAMVISPAAEGLNADTLQKTLCQYYPDHVTPSPRDNTPQENATQNLIAEDVPEQAMHSPFLTSGLSVLPRIPTYGQQDKNFVGAGSRGGYSTARSMDSQQLQQQPCSPRNIPESVAAQPGVVEGQLVPGMDPLMVQDQNSTERLPNCLHSINIYQNSGEKFKDAFLGIPSQTGDTESPRSFSDESVLQIIENEHTHPENCLLVSNPNISSQNYHQQVQFEIQQQADDHYGPQDLAGPQLSNQLSPTNLVECVPDLDSDRGDQTQSAGNQGEGSGTENALPLNGEVDDACQSARVCHSMGWIDLNSSPQPQAWKTFGSQLQKGQAGSSRGGIQKQDFKLPSIHQQKESPQFAYKQTHNHMEQPQHGMMPTYQNASEAAICDSYRFDRIAELHPQLEYSHGPVAKKQCLQQHPVALASNQKEVPHLPPAPTLMQKSAQFPHGASNQQEPELSTLRMCLKEESRGSCSQQELQQTPPHGEIQRHAALRMYLLQKQERQEHQHNPEDFKHPRQTIKTENGLRSEPLSTYQGRDLGNPSPKIIVKQEEPHATCTLQQEGIIATMQHQLKQYQLPPNLHKWNPLAIKSPNKVKVETSGPVTILSMNADLEGANMGPTAKKNSSLEFNHDKNLVPSLSTFLQSPRKLLDPRIKSLLDTPMKTQYEFPSCHCVEQLSEKDEGPYYTHLGAAPNVAAIRELMEQRFGQTGSSIRIEKVVYTGKEGKSTLGCPIAKWVFRRASVDEKLLVLVRERAGHTCATAAIVVVIIIWEGISTSLADRLYTELSDTLTKHGALTNRRCAHNEERTCACQGLNPDTCGASFSFGCSWSMYYNGCKFARSKNPKKFKLLVDDPKEEEKVEQHLQNLATLLAPIYKKMAPDAYSNQVEHENRALNCRLGLKDGRPFSGVTACLDFCAHAHRDLHNMQGGSTVVCTLTREDNRVIGKIPEDEQLHVLPLYKVSQTDEFGSIEGQQMKMQSGAIQVLSVFRRKVRMLSEPAKSCRQRKLESKKAAANKASNLDTPNSKGEKALQIKLKQENTAQNTAESGAVGLGHQPHPVTPQQQQLQQPPPYPSSPQHPQLSYPCFPRHAEPFPSTSQSSLFSKLPASVGSYPSALHVSNESRPAGSYPVPLNRTNTYPGHSCNGTISVDGYNPYYASNAKHLSVYPPQGPPMYSQQFSTQPRFGVNYPPQHGDHGAQVGSYSQCHMTPSVPPRGPYPSLGLNSRSDIQYMEAISQQPSSHLTLDYGVLNKSSQYSGTPNLYFAQGSKMFNPGQDSLHMRNVPEADLHGVNGLALGTECSTEPSFGFLNGNVQGGPEKQESGGPNSGDGEEQWSDNEHNFLDPNIGGVAVAPSHGSILIECAKRELHATTQLKNPDRKHPTRISLVFYQHKSLNEAKHGLAQWEAKMAEKNREKEEDGEKNGNEGTPGKSRKIKREHVEMSQYVEPPRDRFGQTMTRGSEAHTTNTHVYTAPYVFTKVTGPYSKFI